MARVTTDQRVQTVALLVLAASAIGFALYWLKPVMLPFVIAVLLMLTINPIADWICSKIPVPRWVALGAVLLVGVAAFPVVGAVMTSSVSEFAAQAETYQEEIIQITTNTVERLQLERFGLTEAEIEEAMGSIPIGTYLGDFANGIIGFLSNGVLVGVFLLFLLLGSRHRSREEMPPIWLKMTNKVQRYLIAKLAVSSVTGVVVGLILWAIGVPLAGMFGFMAFVLNFIPSVGSIIATLLPLPLILVSPDSTWVTVVLGVAIPGAAQFTIGNVIEPKILGISVDLHPVVILMGLIFWGTLWGIVGMLVATPIVAIVKILLEQYELTRPVAVLMAGRLDEVGGVFSMETTPTEPREIPAVVVEAEHGDEGLETTEPEGREVVG